MLAVQPGCPIQPPHTATLTSRHTQIPIPTPFNPLCIIYRPCRNKDAIVIQKSAPQRIAPSLSLLVLGRCRFPPGPGFTHPGPLLLVLVPARGEQQQ